jgi:hypothetical protein
MYRSIDEGIAKDDFDSFLNEALDSFPKGTEITVHDLSNYPTAKEQFEKGLSEGFMKLVTLDD